MENAIAWSVFGAIILIMMYIDLFVVHRKAQAIHIREALIASVFWVFLAAAFGVGIYFHMGQEAALKYAAGYIIEKSLSVDNLFVFIVIFSYFQIPVKYQHRILFWGIIGAFVMRAAFIYLGVTLIHQFHWIMYIFGAFLLFTGLKMLKKDDDVDPEKNLTFRFLRKYTNFTEDQSSGQFFVRQDGKLMMTTLFVVLIIVETTDLVFALDSIPAILAISDDIFIIYTSNVFAILGLRALYFALSGVMKLFHYLHYGLSAVLSFIGIKMLIAEHYKISIVHSLGIIISLLVVSVVVSLLFPPKKKVLQQ